MSQPIDDITIPTEWVSINILSGIPVGTAIKLQNKGRYTCVLAEGTKPSDDSVNGLLKVDPSTVYPYSFIIQFRFTMRMSGAQTRRLYIQIRKPDGVTIVDSFPFDFGSDIGNSVPFFLSAVLQTRIFSGGTDPFQTQGFKVFLLSDPVDSFTFNPADTNNFQVNFERA